MSVFFLHDTASPGIEQACVQLLAMLPDSSQIRLRCIRCIQILHATITGPAVWTVLASEL